MSKPRQRVRATVGSQVSTGVNEVRLQDAAAGRPMSAHYAGASQMMRELIGWVAPAGDADAAIPELDLLRRRSYDLARNAPIVTGAISTHRIETIGPGLALQSRVNDRLLATIGIKTEEEEIAKLEDQLESLFALWSENPRECDAEQTKTFADHQDLMLVSEMVAGEGITLAVERRRRDSPWRMRLQSVHPARLSNPNFSPASTTLDGGIERSPGGAVFRYWFQEAHPETDKTDAPRLRWRPVDRYARSGRQQVYHLFRSDQAGQSRGVPLLAPIIHKLKQMDRYTDGEIMAAVVGGMVSVIFASETGEMPDFDGDDELKEGAEKLGVNTESELALGHGTMFSAPDGMKPHVVAPGRPNPSFDPFVMSVLRQIGVALELPFEVLIGHFQSSYSAARAAILKAWKATIVRRERVSKHFCTPVYQAWLYEAADQGLVDLPGFFEAGWRGQVARAAWGSCTWVGPPRGSIDPNKEYNAELDLNDALLKPRSDISQLLTGQDWDQQVHRIAREERLIKRLKLNAGRRSSTEAADDPDAADEAENSRRTG